MFDKISLQIILYKGMKKILFRKILNNIMIIKNKFYFCKLNL